MKQVNDINDPRVAKALAHPLRVRILDILEQRVATPKELAAELATSLEALSYHVRTLARSNLIELVEQRQKRGAVEHHYRATARPTITQEAWTKVPDVVRHAMLGSKLAQVGELACASATAGGFDRDGSHIARQRLTLDGEGFAELSRALDALREQAEEIERRAAERLGDAAADGRVDVGLVVMLFEAAREASPSAATRRPR